MNLLSIIIVNYRTPELTRRCVESIYATSAGEVREVIIVDNDSKELFDDSLEKEFPTLQIIKNSSNVGFGRANNLGAQHAQGKYLLFLNSDMILKADTLSTCYQEIKQKGDIGVLSCKILNEDGSLQRSLFYDSGTFRALFKENLVIDKFYHFKEYKIRAVIGAFMLIPKTVFEKVGGFDPDFFMYSEELDLCDRIRKSGYSIKQTNKTTALHKHGGSTKDSLWSKKQKLVSSQLYYRKKFGFLGLLTYYFILFFNYFTNFIAMWFLDKQYRRGYYLSFKNYLSSFNYFWSVSFFIFRKKKGFLKVE